MVFEHMEWHFGGILLTIVLAFLQGRVGRVGTLWQILYALPGTFLHELSHFIVALVTGGRPTGFSIIPHPQPCYMSDGTIRQRWTLGSVTLTNAGLLSAFPTAMAPLALNLVAWQLYRHWFDRFPADPPHILALYGAVYLLVSGSVPSGQDLRIACSRPAGIVLYGALVVGGGAWWNGWLATGG
jgi:hypothetical protein